MPNPGSQSEPRAAACPAVAGAFRAFAVTVLLAGTPALAAPQVEWIARYAGSVRNSAQPVAMVVDSSTGRVFVTGNVWGPTPYRDILTLCFDADGSVAWMRTFDGAGHGDDFAATIQLSPSGAVYVAGTTASGGGTYDYVTLKYSAAGELLWEATFDGATGLNDLAAALGVSQEGGDGEMVYVTGTSDAPALEGTVATVKYFGASGAEIWRRALGGEGLVHRAVALTVDDQHSADPVEGAIYIAAKHRPPGLLAHVVRTFAYDFSGDLLGEYECCFQIADYWSSPDSLVADPPQGAAYLASILGGEEESKDLLLLRLDPRLAAGWAVIPSSSPDWPFLDDHQQPVDLAIALEEEALYLALHLREDWQDAPATRVSFGVAKFSTDGERLWENRFRVPHPGELGDLDDFVSEPTKLATGPGESLYVTGTSDWSGKPDARGLTTAAFDGEDGSLLWSSTFETARDDWGVDVAVDVDQNRVYVAGETSGGGEPSVVQLLRYDPATGSEVWSAINPPLPRVDRLASDRSFAHATAVAADGSTLLTGSTEGGGHDREILTVKLAPNGAVEWARTFGSALPGDEEAYALALDGDGNVFVAGTVTSAGGDLDFVTVKYDSSGVELWARTYAGAGEGLDSPNAIAADGAGGVYVTGGSLGATGGTNYATLKYDGDGNLEWEALHDGAAGGPDTAYAIGLDEESGAIYVTGSAETVFGGSDFTTVKYSADGEPLWVRILGGDGFDLPYAVAVDGAGNVVVAGYAVGPSGTADYLVIQYDPLGEPLWVRTYDGDGGGADFAFDLAIGPLDEVVVTGASLGSSGGANYVTVKYQTDGTLSWVRSHDGAGGIDLANAVAIGPLGEVYVTGQSTNAFGNLDFATVKYDAAGNALWVESFGGGGSDRAFDAVAAPGGAVVVAGTSSAPDGTPDIVAIRYAEPDVTAPFGTILLSTEPLQGVWANAASVEAVWTGAQDELGGSGLAGYSLLFDHLPVSVPDAEIDLPQGEDPHEVVTPLAEANDWYLHLAACDLAGNCSAPIHAGPFQLDRTAPTPTGAILSPSHDGGPSSVTTIETSWGAASDALAGVGGYDIRFDSSAATPCDGTPDIDATVTETSHAVPADGAYHLHVCAIDRAGNPGPVAHGGPWIVDTTPPAGLSAGSSSHALAAWSNDPTVDFELAGASDTNGVAGYSFLFDESPTSDPDLSIDTASPVLTVEAASDGDAWYLHVRACDVAGNCGESVHLGPFWIDTTPPEPPAALTSPSHEIDTPSNEPVVQALWSPASDQGSGVAGYAWLFAPSDIWECDEALDNDAADLSATSAALGTGDWWFHLCAVDAAGNWGPEASLGPFAIDVTPPHIVSVGSVARTSADAVLPGATLWLPITQLLVRFDEPMDPDTVELLASYRLVGTGANGAIETTSCAAAEGDDAPVVLDWAIYDALAATGIVGLQSRVPLAAGSYRLLACSGLTDGVGNGLDGDADGVAGGPFTLDFAVGASDLFVNPNFDGDLATWELTGTLGALFLHSTSDTDEQPSSGSAIWTAEPAAFASVALSQCVPLPLESAYGVRARLRVAGSASSPRVRFAASYFAAPGCSGALSTIETKLVHVGPTAGSWIERSARFTPPAGAAAARFEISVDGEVGTPHTVELDRLWVDPAYLFADDFESGDGGGWGALLP